MKTRIYVFRSTISLPVFLNSVHVLNLLSALTHIKITIYLVLLLFIDNIKWWLNMTLQRLKHTDAKFVNHTALRLFIERRLP